jgi:hypothetical protein
MDFDQVLVGPPEMFHPLPPIGRPGLADGCVGTECSPRQRGPCAEEPGPGPAQGSRSGPGYLILYRVNRWL